ncbi:hypothetical protein ACFW9D_05685 [Streptomyces sp. NPDC059524]|uniref:hypothetical protein n=1 Tax=Streptomyces sp. NPDC059524 TaxID=3346856 RepID=UPI0036ADE5D8
MTNCTSCKGQYDETDARAAAAHTEPVHCNARRTCRCQGKPGCYPCGDSFCLCSSH